MSEIDHTYWYASRAAGIVAYVLAFASTALGLSLTGDVLERWAPRFRLYDIHRFLSLMTLTFVLLHVLIVLPDRYFSFSLLDLAVPFAGPYRPLYTALGVIAVYLMLIVVGSFYLRGLVPYRVWRWLHYLTFAIFVLSLAHGIGAGTDTQSVWVQYLYAVTALITFNLFVYRTLRGSVRGIPVRGSAGTTRRQGS